MSAGDWSSRAQGVQVQRDEREPVESVVALLEYALEEARRGEGLGVAIVLVQPGAGVSTAYARGTAPIADLHYGAATLVRRLLEHGEEGEE